MSEHSETRRELEASIRSLLPDDLHLPSMAKAQSPNPALAAVGGLVSGYCWGWLRGRRSRRRRNKAKR